MINYEKYIDSKDVRDYIKRKDIKLNLIDLVTLIYLNNSITTIEKRKDLLVLIDEYKDNNEYKELIDWMKSYIETSDLTLEEFYDNSDSIYEYYIYELGTHDKTYISEDKFKTVDECLKDYKKYCDSYYRLTIFKYSLVTNKNVAHIIFDKDNKLIDVVSYNHKPFIFYKDSKLKEYIPFNQGDIVINCNENTEIKKPYLIIQDKKDIEDDCLFPNVAYVNDDGEMAISDLNITSIEYYRGDKNTNEYKLLLLYSDFLRGVISIECFIEHLGIHYERSKLDKLNNKFSPLYPFKEEIENKENAVWIREEKS